MKVICREWDGDVLHDLPEDRDFDLVMSIPLSEMAESDRWGWLQEFSGTYAVCSAYCLIQEWDAGKKPCILVMVG